MALTTGRRLTANTDIFCSKHAMERMVERGFTKAEINKILRNGELYRDTKTGHLVRYDASSKSAVVYEVSENGEVSIITVLGKNWKKLEEYIKSGRWLNI